MKKELFETFRSQSKNHVVTAVDAIKIRHLTSNDLVENAKPKRRETQHGRKKDQILRILKRSNIT